MGHSRMMAFLLVAGFGLLLFSAFAVGRSTDAAIRPLWVVPFVYGTAVFACIACLYIIR